MRLLVLLAAGLVLAGCLGGSPAAPQDAQPSAATNATAPVHNATVDDGSSGAEATTGAQPHKHDYWKGRERVTVLQGDVVLSPQNRSAFVPFFLEGRPALGAAIVGLPDGQIVFEGTGRLELTATWSDPGITGLSLRYRSTGNPDFTPPVALATGETVAIDVSPEMTDEPHAKSSRWAFLLEADGPAGGAGLANGKVTVKADIVKMRDIETFPAHPDLFAGQDSVKLFDGDLTIKSDGVTENAQGFFARTLTPPGFAPDRPVPPEATMVLVRFDVKSVTTNVPAQDTSQLRLEYRTAESAFGYDDANLTTHEGKTYVFTIESTPQQGDGYYAKASAWRFDPVITDNVQGQEVDCFLGDCFTWTMETHVTIVAYKS